MVALVLVLVLVLLLSWTTFDCSALFEERRVKSGCGIVAAMTKALGFSVDGVISSIID